MVGHLLVALALLSGEIDVRATATAESRVGEAPILAGNEASPFFAEIVTPSVMLHYSDPRLTFQASYSPHVYWQEPNALNDRLAPLLLQTVDLQLTTQSTRRLSLLAAMSGSYGEPDYSQLILLVPSLGAPPPVVEIASASGHLTARVTLTRRWELDLGGQGLYWKSLSIADGYAAPPITSQISAAEQATALYHLTLRQALGFGAAASEAKFNTGLEVYTIGPTVTWKVKLTPRDDLKLTLGVTYVHSVGNPALGDVTMPLLPGGHTVSPVGAFELVSRVARRDELFISSIVGGGVDYFVNPVLGLVSPRALLEAGAIAIMAPDWMATVRGDFATAIRTTPYSIAQPGYMPFYPDETVFSLTASVRRRITDNFFGELGGLWSEHAPAFVTPGFEFRERQLWLFARVTWMSHPLPRVVN